MFMYVVILDTYIATLALPVQCSQVSRTQVPRTLKIHTHTHTVVLTAVIRCLLGSAPSSSQLSFQRFRELAKTFPCPVSVRWVPGHMGIKENMAADALAKEGSKLPVPEDALPTLAAIRRQARDKKKELFRDWWETHAPRRYRDLGLGSSPRRPPELWLPRPLLHRLLAARSGHGDFAAYHRRFNHAGAQLTCLCGREKSPEHFLLCRRSRPHRPRDFRSGDSIIRLLGPKGCKEFREFVSRSGCYDLPPAPTPT
jgi:hypothetical protein